MHRFKGYALVLLAATLWGTLGIAGRRLYALGLTPEVVVAVRSIAAAIVLGIALALLRPGLLRVRLRHVPYLIAYGVISVGLFNLLYFVAIQHIPVATAAVLLYTAPLFVSVLGRLLFAEPLTPFKWAALAVSLFGVSLVAGVFEGSGLGASAGGSGLGLDRVGLLAGLGAGFTYGLYSVFGKYGVRRYAAWTLLFYTQVVGGLTVAPLAGLGALASLRHQPESWAGLLYLAIGPTLVAYGAYLLGLGRIESSHASITATLEPVVAALLGFLLLGETVGWVQVLGIGLVVGGVALLQLPAARARGSGARGPGATGPGTIGPG